MQHGSKNVGADADAAGRRPAPRKSIQAYYQALGVSRLSGDGFPY
jgi:hypothetical protein